MMNDVQTTIVWHDARKELPRRSGEYLVATEIDGLPGCGNIMVTTFSTKLGKWNCYDRFNNRHDDSFAITGVFAWAEYIPVFGEIYNAFHPGVTLNA